MREHFQIAIDGPVASGKGTLAVGLAKRLGCLYVYTGAMYRALALLCLTNAIDLHNEEAVLQHLRQSSIELKEPESDQKRTFTVVVNGEDVSERIHEKEVDNVTPIVAAMPSIRQEIVALQKKIAEGKRVVMEGRDIATHVLPHADLKIFLTASLEERTKRRYLQLKKRGIERSLEQIVEEIKERDRQDTQRDASPLTIHPDAVSIDTTHLTVEETIHKVVEELRKKGLND